MNCDELRKFIHPYLDGESCEEDRGEFSAHLKECAPCRKRVRIETRFRQKLRGSLRSPAAPPELRQQVVEGLRGAEAAEGGGMMRRWAWGLAPVGVGLLLIAGVMVSRRVELADLAEQSVQWHRTHVPMDVAGPQIEPIQRFFSNKVPFAVRPPHFLGPHTQLVGARLSSLRGHQAAYLTYEIDGQRVSVFVVDANVLPAAGEVIRAGSREIHWHGWRGYNIALYEREGTGYAIASEMDRSHLVELIAHSR